MASPLIGYVGGKRMAIKTLLDYIPHEIKDYREPFVGGGSVLIGLLQNRVKPDNISIGDMDYDICNMWEQVITNPEELIAALDNVQKDKQNILGLSGVEAAARFIVNNRLTKYGNYGVEIQGEEREKALNRLSEDKRSKICTLHNMLIGVQIRHESYEWALTEPSIENTLVFLDPPYTRVSKPNGYYINHLGFDFNKLKAELQSTKHRFIMTIDANEFGYNLKDSFEVIEYDILYRMSMSKHKELIIKNF